MNTRQVLLVLVFGAFSLCPALALSAVANGHVAAPITVAPGVQAVGIQSARTTDDQIADLQRRIEEQNGQISDLRRRNEALSAQVGTLASQFTSLSRAFAGHTHSLKYSTVAVLTCQLTGGKPSDPCIPNGKWQTVMVSSPDTMTGPPAPH